jgi:hypothetical protein
MIFGKHEMGVTDSLIVEAGAGDGSAGSLMTMIITDWFMGAVRQSAEALSRADVERLRDLCDEALA